MIKKRGAPKKPNNAKWNITGKKRNFLMDIQCDAFLNHQKAQGIKPSVYIRELIKETFEYIEWEKYHGHQKNS